MELDLNPTKNQKPLVFAFKIALIFALYTLLLQLFYNAVGIQPELNQQTISQYKYLIYVLNYLPYILAIYFVQKKYAVANNSFTFLQKFSAGFKVVGCIALFASIVLTLYFKFISPEVFVKMKELSIQNANNSAEIRNAKKMSEYIGMIYLFGSIFGYLISGIFLNIISALFVPNKP